MSAPVLSDSEEAELRALMSTERARLVAVLGTDRCVACASGRR